MARSISCHTVSVGVLEGWVPLDWNLLLRALPSEERQGLRGVREREVSILATWRAWVLAARTSQNFDRRELLVRSICHKAFICLHRGL